jgi:hypothetical protein
VPCDVGDCPYLFSPGGEGALHPDNEEAVWLWKRLKVVGPLAFDFLTLRLTEAEALGLLEKLYELDVANAELKQRFPDVRLLWEQEKE